MQASVEIVKPCGTGHAEPRHLRKVCAFAAEELAHVLVALREQVNILVAHSKSSSNLNISEIITTTAGFPKKPEGPVYVNLHYNRYEQFFPCMIDINSCF